MMTIGAAPTTTTSPLSAGPSHASAKAPVSPSPLVIRSPRPQNNDDTRQPSKQCWECQRRDIVCDSIEPVCGKCAATGVVCPGFDDKKPLVWLAPGKITARPRKKKRAPNGSRALAKAAKQGANIVARLTGEKEEAIDWEPIAGRLLNVNAKRKPARHDQHMYDSTFILFPELVYDQDIEQIFQAARYYDMQIYPEYSPILEMIPEAFIRRFDLPTVPFFPASIRESLICITLGHRIHKLPANTDPGFVARSWEVFYRHRGKAITALTVDMSSISPVQRFIALVGTATFLMLDFQQCYPDWKIHYAGLHSLINLCGGLDFVQSLTIETKSLMHVYVLLGMFANTVTHRSQQLTCVTPAEQRRFIRHSYDEKLMPYFMYPPTLLLAMVDINELRGRGPPWHTQYHKIQMFDGCNDSNVENNEVFDFEVPIEESLPSPEALLAQIDTFDPIPWAARMTTLVQHQPQIIALGQLFQTTTRLFCILSLQSVGLLPSDDPELELEKALYGDKLFAILRADLHSNVLTEKSCLFSLAVAGFLAKERGERDRVYVKQECEFLSRSGGQASPLMLVVALQAFWNKGDWAGKVWDDCFDKGYALSIC